MRTITAILFSASCAALAQEGPVEPAPTTLAPVVVTATREPEPIAAVAGSVEVIGARELRERTARTFPEIFEETPGVAVQKTAHGQGSPFIRGFTGFRNLLMIDGIRLNHAAFREGPNQYWATVDPLMAESVELVKGQGSVLYGSDAIGGTVNVLTKSADVLGHGDGEPFAGGAMLYRWASAEQSHTGRVEGDLGIGGQTGIHFGYSARDYGDVRAAGLGELPKTGYGEHAFDVKVDHFFSPTVKLTLAYQQHEQDDVWRTHKTVFGRSWAGTSVGSELQRVLDQKRQLAYAQLEATDLGGAVDDFRASLSWHRHGEGRDRVRSDGRRDVQGFDLDSYGAWLQLGSDTAIGRLTYGASYYQDRGETFRRDYNADGSFKGDALQGPFGDDATYHLFGLFLQDKAALTDRLDLSLGGRYTYARADIGTVADPATGQPFSIDDDWHNFSASGRLLWDAAGDGSLNLFTGVAQGFRAPNFSDLSRLDSARSSEIETPSPGLDPEKFISYEVGARVTRERLHGGVSFFYTDIEDIISRTPTGSIVDGASEVIKKNGSSGYVYGIELDATYDLTDRLRLFGNFAWNDGKADTFPTSAPISVEEHVSRLLPPTGVLGLRWDATDRLWLEVSGFAAGKQDRINTRDAEDTERIPPGGTPGYALLNVRAGYQATDRLLLTAAIENVTDEEYRVHGSGQNEPGVGVVLGASVEF